MKLRDALTRSIRSYYDGNYPEEAIKASGRDFPYTLEYFEKREEKPSKKGRSNEKG